MIRRLFLSCLLISAACAGERPHVVLIYADDLGWGDLSCYGAERVKTPNLDRLAKEGIRFSSGYATSATCTPSRYSMLTGKYAFRVSGTGVLPGDAAMILKPGSTTMGTMFQKAGYRTGVVGKWHLGLGAGGVDWNRAIHPGANEVGFDFSFLMAATGDRVPCVYVEDGKVVNLDPADPIEVSYQKPFDGLPTGVTHRSELEMDWSHGHNMAVVGGIGRIGYMKGGVKALWKDEEMADVFAGQAVKFIREAGEKPFFLYFALHDIHVPRVPHPRFVGATEMGPRGDAIVQADWQVGEILRVLDEKGLAENTLVIFTSDNGPVLDDGYKDDAVAKLGGHRPAGPWRGGKYSLYEGGTRVPFLVRWPAKIKGGGVSEAMISQVDLPRTFAKLAGVEVAEGDFPDSQELTEALCGLSAEGRDHVVQHASRLSIRVGSWKLVPGGAGQAKSASTGTELGNAAKDQLYDLGKDPGEKKNLAVEFPEKVEELKKKLDEVRGAKS